MNPAAMTIDEKRRLGWMVLAWWNALLVGNPAPSVLAAYERARALRPGDYVAEMSTLLGLVKYPDRYEPDVLKTRWDGQFTLYVRSEIREYDDEGNEWSEEVHICTNPDGTEFAWTNADLIAIPIKTQETP